MYSEKGKVYVESDDQCNTCTYYLSGTNCPLLEALFCSVVKLEDDTLVQNCDFYKEFERKLRVIKKKGNKQQ